MASARRIIVEDAEPEEKEDGPTEETTEESKEESRPEPKPQAKRPANKVQEEDNVNPDENIECPKCYSGIKRQNLSNHMYHAHGEDRRAKEGDRKEGEVDLPPPEKISKKAKESNPGKKKKTAVSSTWFGSGAE